MNILLTYVWTYVWTFLRTFSLHLCEHAFIPLYVQVLELNPGKNYRDYNECDHLYDNDDIVDDNDDHVDDIVDDNDDHVDDNDNLMKLIDGIDNNDGSI